VRVQLTERVHREALTTLSPTADFRRRVEHRSGPQSRPEKGRCPFRHTPHSALSAQRATFVMIGRRTCSVRAARIPSAATNEIAPESRPDRKAGRIGKPAGDVAPITLFPTTNRRSSTTSRDCLQ